MRIKQSWCLVGCMIMLIGGVAPPLRGESTITCPPGQIDILDWLTLDADLRSTKFMKGPGGSRIYTVMQPDKYWWLKNSAGTAWDVQLIDNSYVYQYITELTFGDPTDYKRVAYDTNQPMMTRCAAPGYPGTAVAVPDTSFYFANNCSEYELGNVAYAIYELWGPYTAGQPGLETDRPPIGCSVGNNTPVYTLSYRWACDSSYDNCGAKEEYILAQRYGLVTWNYWELQGGQYVLVHSNKFNCLTAGTATPNFPCF